MPMPPATPASSAHSTAFAPRPPSLAAAKLYAMDLAALMVPDQDGALRDAARHACDAASLRRWLEETAAFVSARAGGDRAALFLGKVSAMLPANFFADGAQARHRLNARLARLAAARASVPASPPAAFLHDLRLAA